MIRGGNFFANVLLDPIDHFVKDELRIPGYVRYADDLVLFDDDKSRLWHARQRLSERLSELRLRLHRDKTQLRPCDNGLKFLGFKLERSGRRLQQTGIRRFNQRLRLLQREFADGRINADAIRRSLQAWLAHVRDANTTGLRRSLWKRVRFQRRPRKSVNRDDEQNNRLESQDRR